MRLNILKDFKVLFFVFFSCVVFAPVFAIAGSNSGQPGSAGSTDSVGANFWVDGLLINSTCNITLNGEGLVTGIKDTDVNNPNPAGNFVKLNAGQFAIAEVKKWVGNKSPTINMAFVFSGCPLNTPVAFSFVSKVLKPEGTEWYYYSKVDGKNGDAGLLGFLLMLDTGSKQYPVINNNQVWGNFQFKDTEATVHTYNLYGNFFYLPQDGVSLTQSSEQVVFGLNVNYSPQSQ